MNITASITYLADGEHGLAPIGDSYNGGEKGMFVGLHAYVERELGYLRTPDQPYDHGEASFSDGRGREFFYMQDGELQWDGE